MGRWSVMGVCVGVLISACCLPPDNVAANPTIAEPTAIQNGIPQAWLVGGIHDGPGGMSIYGLDTETVSRANPNQPYLSSEMAGGRMRSWTAATPTADGITILLDKTDHSYGWSRGTGYAQLYLKADVATTADLRYCHSGINSAVWLDGRPLTPLADVRPPQAFPDPGQRPTAPLEGRTTEGLRVTAMPEQAQSPQVVRLNLSAGWHSLLLKFIMQHDKDQTFFFAAQFTEASGRPLQKLMTQVADPMVDPQLNARAGRIRPLFFVQAPANLPHAREALKIVADMRWHPVLEDPEQTVPIEPFPAILRLVIKDFDGNEVARREVNGTFPAEVVVDFGTAPATGYYAIYPSLHTAEGKLIMAYYADGFTVAPGTAAQNDRLEKKKLWINNYYLFADNAAGRGYQKPGELFVWLARSGLFKNVGSTEGYRNEDDSSWQTAGKLGLVLFGDTARDSANANDTPEAGAAVIRNVARHTRFFKCVNEIDIRTEEPWLKVREPEHWVKRMQWEHEAVHRARPDGVYVGGSLVRVGDMKHEPHSPKALGAGEWFAECLKLGLDRYQDYWEVHAYPQKPPRLDGPLGNSPIEDERGVLAAYQRLGRENKLPFWLGECGAKAAHCPTGRRGQADLAAKMIAWVNSRENYLGLGFCIGQEYDWGYGRLWDYSMGHKPGEAALITASALIDGLPCHGVEVQDENIQAARFGPTLMIWRTDGRQSDWSVDVAADESWVSVNVVGTVTPLHARDGKVTVRIGESPLYVLPRSSYERLTRF